MKTRVDSRPDYHKNDISAMAHLLVVLLTGWLVNTTRHLLKQSAILHV
ncbi:hypothetical protein [Ferruginibacter sp.]|nr:hypothetical protein [Ferruginibacter sp.]MBC7626869.1 hypothetical protein [Ferruginibacter sp.]